ncbi:MAG TPA: indole-3-glycerol-phosphate synthase [Steroidobacteraceae bacterium]|jgi:indole-3-glycerol phosphate synthase|nr:indole-3-glycerol-phosphate synthase [Steroidobacteraceae bacterium]
MSTDFLASMAHSSHARVERASAEMSAAALRAQALQSPRPPALRLSSAGFDLIAEVKLRSPAAGRLGGQAEDIGARVAAYAAAGAAAISVITEPSRFEGELSHLAQAAQLATGVPVMRKDFLVDPYQVYEARLHGAAGVLVILRMLEESMQERMLAACEESGLFALLECFDEADLARAQLLVRRHASRGMLLVGINCRDLVSLQVVPGRLDALAALLPEGAARVAESGVETPADAERLARAGYGVALVGSALMRANDPAALARDLLAQGRAARADTSPLRGALPREMQR